MTPQHLEKFVRKHLHGKLESEIDDVVQSTQVIAWRNREKFRGESKHDTWVFGIALRLCQNVNMRQGLRLDILTSLDEMLERDEPLTTHADESTEPDKAMEQRQTINAIQRGIESLQTRQRIVIELMIEGLSYQQIADRLAIPTGTVRSRINRARAILTKDRQ